MWGLALVACGLCLGEDLLTFNLSLRTPGGYIIELQQ